VKPWQIDPTKWIIWAMSKVGLVSKLRRVPTEKIVLAELAEAQRRLEATLANPGLTDATAAYIANAYHSLRETAQQWTQRKAGQLEVTREMLTALRNEIRVATNARQHNGGALGGMAKTKLHPAYPTRAPSLPDTVCGLRTKEWLNKH
jgi:stearoyl-CoA desaturase (delta-9 desaturase)